MPDRILIIDDEPQITRVLRAALSTQRITMCARRTILTKRFGLFREWTPDLVITDLAMPELERH